MKKGLSISLAFFTAVIAVLIVMASCNKKFDEPPYATDPNLSVTTTITDLKAKHNVYGSFNPITDSTVVSGIVVANDKSGNIYKTLYVVDSTKPGGGIQVLINTGGLYSNYPVGMKVYIKCNGLALSDYNGTIQLGVISTASGSYSLEAIPASMVNQYIVTGSLNNHVPVTVVTLDQLKQQAVNAFSNPSTDLLQSTLVQINNAQFKDISGTLYADTSSNKLSEQRTVQQCGTTTTTVAYNSGYADFAQVPLPKGGGSITAIYVPYKNTSELILRDTSDVHFNGLRCDGSSGGTTTSPRITIATLRAMYTGSDIKIAGPYSIGGVVIGTSTAGSLSNGNIVIQDGNNGISLYFGGTLPYNIGDSVVVDVTGDSLLNYKGSLEVKFQSGTSAPAATATGQVITPKVITIAALNTALATALGASSNIENTLVQIQSVTATPSGVAYTATKTLTDPNAATIAFYTKDASYGTTVMPTTCLNVVGIATIFSGAGELKVRATTDVTTGTGCGGSGGGGGGGGTGTGITLGATSPLLLNFDGIGSGLPTGVSVRTAASATALGTDASAAFIATPISWTKTTAGFKNFASATGLTSTADSTTQANSTNRALGLRQTSATGYDPGAAFVFQINNTTGKTGITLDFLLQSLDATGAPRTITWKVDYATGANPTTFTPATPSGTVTTGNNVFSSNPINVSFGGALDNQTGPVWIRIVTLTGSTGSGNRASSAVDDFKVSWN